MLRHHPSFPDPELAPARDALNCVRILTRILPFLYEADQLQAWEENFFWSARKKRTRKASIASEVLFDGADEGQRQGKKKEDDEDFEDARPLGEELIDTLVDLLFFSDLTVPRQPHGKPKVSYAIWKSGVGCNTAVPTTKEHESNRSEILRLLLTLAGQSMYLSSSQLPQRGVRALTHLCSCPDKQVVLSVLCSLLNTVGWFPFPTHLLCLFFFFFFFLVFPLFAPVFPLVIPRKADCRRPSDTLRTLGGSPTMRWSSKMRSRSW